VVNAERGVTSTVGCEFEAFANQALTDVAAEETDPVMSWSRPRSEKSRVSPGLR
jgi:hypothetical protein